MSPKDSEITESLTGRDFIGHVLSFMAGKIKKLPPLLPDVPLSEGHNLEKYGIQGKILALPGHTKGSIGILLHDGRFIAGDTLMNFGSPSIARMAEDLETLYKSCDRLKKLPITTVYPGHGKSFDYKKMLNQR